MSFLFEPIPFKEAAQVVRQKPVVTGSVFSRMAPELKAYAFTITGVDAADVVQQVRDRIADLPEGANWDDVKKDIAAKMADYLSPKAAQNRAEMLMRIHGLQAYRVGQWEQAQDTKEALPYFKYIATMDARTRPSHAALHGLVLPVDDPFWKTHMPPGWEWMCRCQVVQVSEYDRQQQKEAEKKIPADARRVWDEGSVQMKALREGHITGLNGNYYLNGKEGRTPFSPRSLRMGTELLERYDEPTRNALLAAMRKVQLHDYEGEYTVADWMQGKPLPKLKSSAVNLRPIAAAVVKDLGQNPVLHKATNDALALIQQVHDDGDLPKVRVVAKNMPVNVGGEYVPYWSQPVIHLNPADKYPVQTALHELGHFLDHRGLGGAGQYGSKQSPLKKVMDAIAQTPTIKALRARPKQGKTENYLLDPREQFARAYAQYILIKTGRTDLIGSYVGNFHPSELSDVVMALDELFKQKTWRNQ